MTTHIKCLSYKRQHFATKPDDTIVPGIGNHINASNVRFKENVATHTKTIYSRGLVDSNGAVSKKL